MVSKVAVMALVAIVAVPILMGYALNVETEEGTRYVQSGDSTDVTGLLTNSTTYSYTNANIYEMNWANLATDVDTVAPDFLNPADNVIGYNLPLYNKLTSTKSSMALTRTTLSSAYDLTNVYYMSVNVDPTEQSYLGYTIYYGNSQTHSEPDETYNIFYSKNLAKAWITDNNDNTVEYPNHTRIEFNAYYSDYDVEITSAATMSGSTYVDLTAGWKFRGYDTDTSMATYKAFVSPAKATDMLLSFDLDTYYDPGTYFSIYMTNNVESITMPEQSSYGLTFWKNGTEWYVALWDPNAALTDWILLPYNTEISDNSYQLNFTKSGAELYYVGSWPTTFGPAPAYWSYTWDWETPLTDGQFITGFLPSHAGDWEPTGTTFRVDRANVVAQTYRNISDTTYDPFYMTGKENPATVLRGVARAGSSIVFGGLSFPVSNNTITVDGKTLAINGLKFESVENGSVYTNTINGNYVSNTIAPSSIRFNGSWSMEVSTYEQVSEEYSEVHWIPGGFAWAGVDFNFYLVGLITSLIAFVLLAMYGSRSGAKVGGLLLICGGAAFMFLLLM